MADRRPVARKAAFYFVLPVAGPVFPMVSLCQALTGRVAGDAQPRVPPSKDVRRHSLLVAAGLVAAIALASWAWLHWALPPRDPGERFGVALLAGDLFSLLVLIPWVVIAADISQRLGRSGRAASSCGANRCPSCCTPLRYLLG